MSHPIRKSDAQMRLECIHVATRILGHKTATSELLALADELWDWVIGKESIGSARDLHNRVEAIEDSF
jgi:hypothetical protein